MRREAFKPAAVHSQSLCLHCGLFLRYKACATLVNLQPCAARACLALLNMCRPLVAVSWRQCHIVLRWSASHGMLHMLLVPSCSQAPDFCLRKGLRLA